MSFRRVGLGRLACLATGAIGGTAVTKAFVRRRRTGGPWIAAALVLVTTVGWAQQGSATIGAPVHTLAIDPATPTTLYAGTACWCAQECRWR